MRPGLFIKPLLFLPIVFGKATDFDITVHL